MKTRALICTALATFTMLPAFAADMAGLPLQARINVTSVREMRFKTTLRQQYDYSCGSAAVATLLTYHYDRKVGEQAIFESMFRSGDQNKIRREGFSLLDMQRFLATAGLRADGFELPLSKLEEAKVPAIVLIETNNFKHFVVIKGVTQDRVLVGDPTRGTHAMSRKDFEQIWTSKLLFVVHGYKGAVRFNDVSDWNAAPAARPGDSMVRRGLDDLNMPRNGPGDF